MEALAALRPRPTRPPKECMLGGVAVLLGEVRQHGFERFRGHHGVALLSRETGFISPPP